MLSISRNVRLSVVRLSVVRVFTFEVPFNGLFAPTSRSRMSNIVRDSESLGKEVVSHLNILVWKWSKIAAQKKVFFFTFFGLLRFSVFFNCLFAPTSRSRMSNIFRDSNPWGKVMERSGLTFEHFCLQVV